jgi:hypothetical protein
MSKERKEQKKEIMPNDDINEFSITSMGVGA